MIKFPTPEQTSYAGGAASIVASVTLAQWGVIAGIVTALLTCALNVWYTRQKNAREQRQAELEERERKARLAALGIDV